MQHPGHRRQGLLFLPVAAIILLALAGAVMLLWNAVLPGLVPVQRIDYLHALGLLVLCRILFGRLGGGGMQWRGRNAGGPPWKERWAGMSDEDREKFREGWKQRCAEWKRRRG